MSVVLVALVCLAALVLLGAALGVRVVQAVRARRRLPLRPGAPTAGAGPALLVPLVDRLQKVNMQIVTMPVPAQDGITRDNVTVRVDAVVYFRVVDPVRAAVDVQDYVSRSARSPRRRCARSSARASSTTCCRTASTSTRAWS